MISFDSFQQRDCARAQDKLIEQDVGRIHSREHDSISFIYDAISFIYDIYDSLSFQTAIAIVPGASQKMESADPRIVRVC